MTHHLRASTEIQAPIDEVFQFFSAAENLEKITPPSLRFQIVTPLPIEMKKDTLIDYKLRINGVPANWTTRIPVWQPPFKFVDEQLKGPYKTWVHEHTFEEVGDKTIMMDHVAYELPFFPLGEIAYPFVHRQVRSIFSYRKKTIQQWFGE
ncbi:SRPBCC family protein [Aureibacillus halotolerans]|uniref:Ligand-binding SRPBCC domain-containing protein n=1 Tax=Aureibacillus halotolerans TaxID=1508390 RepID=A0A4R6TQ38_9BACI|nr:SRPBCC family protein [Aureibacillus halotolerans]TDQ33445.1 ligand-binding SRPBCC domain-containing protein [Aureibacillus halotolerans]